MVALAALVNFTRRFDAASRSFLYVDVPFIVT